MDTLTQLYDFQAPEEEPCAIVFHPFNTCFACGFVDGTVRVFDIQSTNLVAEHKQHRGRVTGLVFAPSGGFLFSSGSLGNFLIIINLVYFCAWGRGIVDLKRGLRLWQEKVSLNVRTLLHTSLFPEMLACLASNVGRCWTNISVR
jgi:WD40 repeat protein